MTPDGPAADVTPDGAPADVTPDGPAADVTPAGAPAAGVTAEGPAPAIAGAPDQSPPVVSTELRIIAAGAVRVLLWWPGIVVVLAVYVAVAVALYHHLYPNLWGGLAAAVAALAWYASPMRNYEARRRDRLASGVVDRHSAEHQPQDHSPADSVPDGGRQPTG